MKGTGDEIAVDLRRHFRPPSGSPPFLSRVPTLPWAVCVSAVCFHSGKVLADRARLPCVQFFGMSLRLGCCLRFSVLFAIRERAGHSELHCRNSGPPRSHFP